MARTVLSADLREREKELDFVYELASLLAGPGLDAAGAASGAARLFAAALSHPGDARVRVSVGSVTAAYPEGEPSRGESSVEGSRASSAHRSMESPCMEAEAGTAPACRVSAAYVGSAGSRRERVAPRSGFSERERSLCASAAAMLAVAAERLAGELREREYRRALEVKNAALSELLSRIEMEKSSIRANAMAAIDERVLPLIARLASPASAPGHATAPDRAELVARIRRELSLALGERAAYDPRRRLSRREAEVCDLVASGLSSKEIAQRLGIAVSTVERHRHNARRKLGLPAREGSLGSAFFDPSGGAGTERER